MSSNVPLSTFLAPSTPDPGARRVDLKRLLPPRRRDFLEQLEERRRTQTKQSALRYPPPEIVVLTRVGGAVRRPRPARDRGAPPPPPPRTISLEASRQETPAPCGSEPVTAGDRAADAPLEPKTRRAPEPPYQQLKPKTRRAPEPPLDALPATRWHVPPSPMQDLPPKPSWAQDLKRRCAGLISGPLRDACRALRDCAHRPMSWLGRLLRRSQA